MKEEKTFEDYIIAECGSELWLPNDMPKIQQAIINWLEAKRLLPLSRKGDMIDIDQLQTELRGNKE
jgi:hypothetical protein